MSANPLFNAVSKRKPNESRYLQDVNNHTRLVNGNKHTWRKPAEYERHHGSSMRTDGAMEPPDKRRRTEHGKSQVPSQDPEMWDDDDDFTQADLENIDSIITHSQQVRPAAGSDNVQSVSNMPGYCRSPRAIGRGAVKSLSAGEVGSYPPGNRPTYGGSDSRDGQKSTYSSRFTSGLGTSVASSYPSSSKYTFQRESKTSSQTPLAREAVSTVQKGDFTSIQRNEVEKLKEDLEFYKKEHSKLKATQQGKDGQISMLRRSLQEKETAIANMHHERVQFLDEQAQQRSEKEKALEKELERVQTQLQFKEHEIVELQGTCRKLELKTRSSGSSGSESPRRPQSPRRVPPRSPQVQRSPRGSSSTTMSPPSVRGAFPTQQSFMARERSVAGKSSSSMGSTEQGTSGSSAANGTLSLGIDVSSKKVRTQKMKLPVSICAGSSSGSYILSKMMRASPSQAPEPAVIPAGIMGLLQHPPGPVDPSALRLQRDPSGQNFSPARPKRPSMSSLSSSASMGVVTGSSMSLVTSAVCQQVVTTEHYALATQSLSWLLAEDVEGSCESAVLLLPLIEDYVSAYLMLVTSALDSHTASQPASLTSYGSLETNSSIESLSSSMAGCLLEGAARANQLEAATLNALRTLHSLVNYSQHAAQALVCDNYADLVSEVRRSQEERRRENGNRSQMADGARAATPSQAAALPGTSIDLNSSGPGHLDVSVTRITRDLQLLHKVIMTANPLLPNGQAARASIVEVSLQVLCRVASICGSVAAHGFGALFTQDVLLNCFSDKDCINIPSFLPVRECAIDLLTALARHDVMLTKFCSHTTDDCILMAMYNVVVPPLEGNRAYKLRFTLKVLAFLSQMLSYHKSGPTVLLESDCHCSVEVVKCIILILTMVLHEHRQSSSPESLLALRQGCLLLVVVAQKDKLYHQHRLEVEHDYVELVCGMDEIFRENPLVQKHEVAAVRELWDFEQDYPESCESDETAMEEDADGGS